MPTRTGPWPGRPVIDISPPMLSAFIGELLHKGDGDPENLFKVNHIIAGDSSAPPVSETGCTMSLEIADHAYVLDDGHVVYSGPARELAADQARVESLAGASAEEWTPQ